MTESNIKPANMDEGISMWVRELPKMFSVPRRPIFADRVLAELEPELRTQQMRDLLNAMAAEVIDDGGIAPLSALIHAAYVAGLRDATNVKPEREADEARYGQDCRGIHDDCCGDVPLSEGA